MDSALAPVRVLPDVDTISALKPMNTLLRAGLRRTPDTLLQWRTLQTLPTERFHLFQPSRGDRLQSDYLG
jgi:hypothetical protein